MHTWGFGAILGVKERTLIAKSSFNQSMFRVTSMGTSQTHVLADSSQVHRNERELRDS